ncbi:hypothetical protein F1642_05765 [Paracoccus sp. NBH48]|nr:hypothetical protein [Paracoccus sp. NBH48]
MARGPCMRCRRRGRMQATASLRTLAACDGGDHLKLSLGVGVTPRSATWCVVGGGSAGHLGLAGARGGVRSAPGRADDPAGTWRGHRRTRAAGRQAGRDPAQPPAPRCHAPVRPCR